MAEQPRPDRVRPGEAGRHVVLHEQPAGSEQVERELALAVGIVPPAARVEKDELERPVRGQRLAPVALDELDIRQAGEALAGDPGSPGVEFGGDKRRGRGRDRLGALAERRPQLGAALPGREDGQQALDLRKGGTAAGQSERPPMSFESPTKNRIRTSAIPIADTRS
jgi:hypothetical protein